MALTYTPPVDLGNSLPNFKLKSMREEIFDSQSLPLNQPVLVMFICNHCPYVKAIEDRLIQLGHDCLKLNVSVIAICSNDPNAYPDDNFQNLQKRWNEKEYSFEYLHDPDQKVAKEFGAVCTPDFFLYDKKFKLAYRGRLDDSWKDSSQVKTRELYQAIIDLTQDKKITTEQIPSMGCSIKWSH